MSDVLTINDRALAIDLLSVAYMCAENDTDNCDIEVNTTKGVIKCHIEFTKVGDNNGANI